MNCLEGVKQGFCNLPSMLQSVADDTVVLQNIPAEMC